MKKTLLALMLLSSTAIFAQIGRMNNEKNQPANHAPSQVQESFQKQHPDARDARWSQTNHEWRANYRDNNRHNVDVYYDRDGVRKDVHRALDQMDVPRNIKSRINNRYGTNGNYRVARIERDNEQPLYQIKIPTHGRYRTVYMDEQGKNRQYSDRH